MTTSTPSLRFLDHGSKQFRTRMGSRGGSASDSSACAQCLTSLPPSRGLAALVRPGPASCGHCLVHKSRPPASRGQVSPQPERHGDCQGRELRSEGTKASPTTRRTHWGQRDTCHRIRPTVPAHLWLPRTQHSLSHASSLAPTGAGTAPAVRGQLPGAQAADTAMVLAPGPSGDVTSRPTC